MEKLLPHAARVGEGDGEADFAAAARGIMTTDTKPKLASARIGAGATLVGIAKGVGMIEPNMATLFVFLFTDARVEPSELSAGFRAAIDRTFNSMSIDTDTSTSDTATIMANGLAGDVDPGELATAVDAVCMELMLATLGDGEGATRTISVTVEEARNVEQARTVGKLVVNSPLVKTAIHGADPNWGRIAMAVGKAERYDDISPERTRISLAGMDVYPDPPGDDALADLARRIGESDLVEIGIALGAGDATATVWGCDLSEEYVRINAEYTT
jgi:glutamate N-acetyltransferase/amino-acid N-acetyltransferase